MLVTSQDGWLSLVEATAQGHRCVSRIKLFPDEAPKDRELWSHPALVGSRLYVRNRVAAYCYRID
ncbi:MAG: hypothetical protein ABR915_01950 [Thermoguttaceae bacterium]